MTASPDTADTGTAGAPARTAADAPAAPEALLALVQRLTAVETALARSGPGGDVGDLPADPGRAAGVRLRGLVVAVQEQPTADRVWLLLVAVAACFPVADDVQAARRRLELTGPDDACVWLLQWAHGAATAAGTGLHRLRLVERGVVVDTDFTAKHDLQTGVQRVLRRLVPRWRRDHALELAVWDDGAAALREPVADERERVLDWTGPLHRRTPPQPRATVLVPWHSTLVLVEVPGMAQSPRLASLAEHSGNRVAVVGHDCIPVVSAELLPLAEPMKYVRYLSLVKHVDVVAAVSESAASEFRGFVSALPTQGLTGPQVVACPLALDTAAEPPAGDADGDPELLVVGSHEPRKNHLAVLHAAELLWRRGRRFRLCFLGGSGWTTEAFDRRVAQLQAAGRPVQTRRGAGDEDLWAAVRAARATVFPSLHEGFGLPVAESLSLGTPVVGSSFGSVAELAADGGVLLIDPRDDVALADALERVLIDDDLHARLAAAARSRPVRTWDDYARELWALLGLDTPGRDR